MVNPHAEKPDIEGRPDIVNLVNHFYGKIREDDLLGPIFASVDWDHHLPRMHAFWQTVLFKEEGFHGNPLVVHAALLEKTPMDWPRFQRWLALFGESVDDLFNGDRAGHIKRLADDMAHVIYSRINRVPDPRFEPANLTPEQRARFGK